jgi:hypothetical protein
MAKNIEQETGMANIYQETETANIYSRNKHGWLGAVN